MTDATVTVDTDNRRQHFPLVSNHGAWSVYLSEPAGIVTITIPLDEDGKAGDPTMADANGNPVEAQFTRREPDAQ